MKGPRCSHAECRTHLEESFSSASITGTSSITRVPSPTAATSSAQGLSTAATALERIVRAHPWPPPQCSRYRPSARPKCHPAAKSR